jgi:hypothetical protein
MIGSKQPKLGRPINTDLKSEGVAQWLQAPTGKRLDHPVGRRGALRRTRPSTEGGAFGGWRLPIANLMALVGHAPLFKHIRGRGDISPRQFPSF